MLMVAKTEHQTYHHVERRPLLVGVENLENQMNWCDQQHISMASLEDWELGKASSMGYDAKHVIADARDMTKLCRCAQTGDHVSHNLCH
jgi:hypothetical protein